jgi:putative ABC transport system permease protein
MGRVSGEWARDLRHAIRGLRRTPGFGVMTVGTLGLAIGVNTGMFSVVDKVLLAPLPYAHADRLVNITASAPGSDLPPEFGVGAEFYLQYKEQSRLLEDVSTYNSFTSTLRVGDRVERILMSWPTTSLFTTLGARPILGRLPVPDDDDRVIVISYALWQSWFGGDPGVLNRVCYVSGADRTIVGVMGPEFRFPDDDTRLWISSRIRPEGLEPGRFGIPLVARMAPGATPAAVAAELTALARKLPERFGGTPAYARVIARHRALVRPLVEEMFGGVARPLWVLLAAAGFVLLIACANVANLFMVRAEARQRDLAVRRAIGAARGQLVRFQMAEVVVVAALAGGVAVGLAALTLPLVLRAAPPGIPRIGDVAISGATLAFTAAAALFAVLACGVVPALRASSPDFARLRDGGRGLTRRRRWVRDGLVAGQTALALVLLIGAGLLLKSFWQVRHVDPGYDTRDVFTFQIAPEGPDLKDGPSYARFDLNFMERLRALPGVQVVGLVENVPLNEGTDSMRFRPDGAGGQTDAGPLLQYTFEAGDYFKAMGIRVLAGRPFESNDHLAAARNIVISRSAAALLWPGGDALGRRVRPEHVDDVFTVIGVVDDVKQYDFRRAAQPLVYFPLVGPTPTEWAISSPAYVVKTPRAEQIAADVRALVHEVAPMAPMYRVFTLARLARDSMVDLSFTMLTLGLAALLALVLGAVGLYSVLWYVVAERTREIGVRMALGARAAQVRRMVVGHGIRVVAIGVGVGAMAAGLLARALQSLLFEVRAVDAGTFAAMSAAMVAIGLVASYLPARRASLIDPIVSLRGD